MGNLPLDGIRIVDWTQLVAGPNATVRLAALGAEVIHVERPKIGDYIRGGPGATPKLKGVSQVLSDGGCAQFEGANFNKKSITVDLTKPEGREIIYRLVGASDVFATNSVSDVVKKMGMGYETLLKYNDRIIYAAASFLGEKGPYRQMPGWDPVGQAASGMMAANGYPDEPLMGAPVTNDHITDYSLFCGIMTALYLREKTGKPQYVETSQLQAGMNSIIYGVLSVYLLAGNEVLNLPRKEQNSALNIWYKCKDSRWIQLAVFTEENWRKFCQEIGKPELIDDPRFMDMKKRVENCAQLINILDGVFVERTLEEWVEKLTAVNVPCYPVNRLRDLPSDPQVLANNYLLSYEHPVYGRIQLPGLPFTINGTLGEVTSPAPKLGEHTQEILLELDYSPEQIRKLGEDGII